MVLPIAELSALASKLSTSNIPQETIPAATTSFQKIITYLRKLSQIGIGNPNTAENKPVLLDVNNIIATGLITNQAFINSLCQLLSIYNIPKINTQQTETEE